MVERPKGASLRTEGVHNRFKGGHETEMVTEGHVKVKGGHKRVEGGQPDTLVLQDLPDTLVK